MNKTNVIPTKVFALEEKNKEKKDTRTELEKFVHVFSSNGDTEVLLSAFLQWGKKCLNKLNGEEREICFP